MSADNYYYLYPVGGKIGVQMRFDSADYSDDITEHSLDGTTERTLFDKLSDAIRYAEGEYTEYGVSFSPDLKVPSYAQLMEFWENNGSPVLKE